MMELHAAAQLEFPGLKIGRIGPRFCQFWFHGLVFRHPRQPIENEDGVHELLADCGLCRIECAEVGAHRDAERAAASLRPTRTGQSDRANKRRNGEHRPAGEQHGGSLLLFR